MITQLDTENADRDLTTQVTVLTHTPSASAAMLCQALVQVGDGTKDLDGTGGDFELEVTVGGNSVQPGPQVMTLGASDTRASFLTTAFPVPANTEVVVKLLSPNGADTDVDVTAYLYDVYPVNVASGVVESKAMELGTQAKLDVNAEADAALGDYDPPTNAELVARTLAAADYFNSATDGVTLTGAQVTALVAAIEAELADDATGEAIKQAIVDKLIENLPDLDDLTLGAISQAVWDRLMTAITTTGSVGKLIKDTLTGHVPQTGDSFARLGTPAGASVSADVAAVKAETAAIVADTNELQQDWANGGRLDLILDTAAAGGGGGGDATEAKQDTIIASLDAVKGATFDTATDSLEAIRNRGDVAWLSSAGQGSIEFDYTLTSSVDAAPIDDALVEVFTDLAMTNKVAQDRTDAFGVVTFYLDAGTYYLRRSKSGWTFVNPDTEVVA